MVLYQVSVPKRGANLGHLYAYLFVRSGDFVELPVMTLQLGWNSYVPATQHALELKRIYRGLAFEVVVGDNKSLLGLGRNDLNAVLPFLQLGASVKIVVAIAARIAVEPLFVVSTVQADVANGRGDLGGGSDCVAQLEVASKF